MHDTDTRTASTPAARTASRRKVVAGATAALATSILPGAHAAAQPHAGALAVVSSDEDATRAGLEMLARGGTAADAAVAMAAVLTVVEPWFSSALGGGTWGLYFDAAAGEVTAVDGVGPVGSRATIEDYRERAEEPGIHQAIVPGAWDGWMLWLDRYGRLELGDILEPAIRLARDGRPASQEMARWLGMREEEIRDHPDTARIYLRDDDLPEAGDVIHQANLAGTFEAIVAAWDDARGESREAAVQAARDYVYRGPLAEAIVAYSDEHDGYLTLDDFAGFEAAVVEPISIAWDDAISVHQCPPNSQGITMLMALNILKGYDLAALEPDGADSIHLQVEAIKLAFADRHQYVGDPDRIEVPVAELLADEHAARQRERISMDTALEWQAEVSTRPHPHHTTTFHIVDGEGNGAAVTTSLGAQFLVVGDTGVHINERMGFLSLEAGNANQLTPGYKVRHTSCPYMAFRNGRPCILGGNTGVDTQPQGQVQQFVNIAVHGMGAREAVGQPRFVTTAFPATTFPYEAGNTLQMQGGFRGSVVTELRRRGHDAVLGEGTFGSANAIVLGESGVEAGAEPGTSMSRGEVIPAGATPPG